MSDVTFGFRIGAAVQVAYYVGGSCTVPIIGLNEICRISSADYEALSSPDPYTLYIVEYGRHIELWLGDKACMDPGAIRGDGSITDLVSVVEMPQDPGEHVLYVKEASS